MIWAIWIGTSTFALNALSLVWFLVVFPSIVSALLFWLMPLSVALGIADIAVYVRERFAVSTSSAAPDDGRSSSSSHYPSGCSYLSSSASCSFMMPSWATSIRGAFDRGSLLLELCVSDNTGHVLQYTGG